MPRQSVTMIETSGNVSFRQPIDPGILLDTRERDWPRIKSRYSLSSSLFFPAMMLSDDADAGN